MGLKPDRLGPQVAELRGQAAAAGLPPPPVAVMTTLPLDDGPAAADLLHRYAAAGATRVIHGAGRYADAAEFRVGLDRLVAAASSVAASPAAG
jgi:hypothetical protein